MECGGRLASTVRTGGDQRLADHLAAEHALPAGLRRAPADTRFDIKRFEVEDVEQVFDGGGHEALVRRGAKWSLNLLWWAGIYKEPR